MKLNTRQESLLAQLREADARYKQARLIEHEAARIAADEKILALLIERDKLAALSFAENVPYAQIGKRGIATSDRLTVKAAVEHGSSFIDMAKVAEEKQAGPYRWDAESRVLTIRIAAAEFKPYERMLVRAPDPSGEEWDFTFDGNRIMPVDPDEDATWEHPVVTVTMTDRGKKAALEYISSVTQP